MDNDYWFCFCTFWRASQYYRLVLSGSRTRNGTFDILFTSYFIIIFNNFYFLFLLFFFLASDLFFFPLDSPFFVGLLSRSLEPFYLFFNNPFDLVGVGS